MTALKQILAGITLAAVLGGALAFGGAALASDDKDDDYNMQNVETAIDMQQAISIAQQQVPGKVTESELDREDGKLVWEVEILGNDQQEWELYIDAQTGAVLKKEQDD